MSLLTLVCTHLSHLLFVLFENMEHPIAMSRWEMTGLRD